MDGRLNIMDELYEAKNKLIHMVEEFCRDEAINLSLSPEEYAEISSDDFVNYFIEKYH